MNIRQLLNYHFMSFWYCFDVMIQPRCIREGANNWKFSGLLLSWLHLHFEPKKYHLKLLFKSGSKPQIDLQNSSHGWFPSLVAMADSLATKGQITSSPGTLNLHEMEPKPLHNTPLTMPAAPKARLPVYPDRGDRFYHQIRQLGII